MLKIISVLIFAAVFAYANEYEDVVKNFLSYQHSKKSIANVKTLKKDNYEVAYLFDLEDGGYVIVPISKKVSPIKAYSFRSDFNDLPLAYKNFLLNELYISLKASSARGINKTTLSRWDFLKDYKPTTKRDLRYRVDSFLLTSTWNQTYPYNKFFPKVNGQSTLVGCVQIALGQLMRYHKYPSKPRGVYKQDIDIYDDKGRKVRTDNMVAVLNKNYNWNNMPDKFDSTTENYQEDEVSYFLRDLAIVNKAKIGVSNTGASVNVDALIENFGYSHDIKRTSTSDITKTEFVSTLKTQISQNLPVLLIFPGHMTVADGYKDDSSGSYIHVNMGWGGHFNDFYNLDETVNAGGYSFSTTSLRMLYDIKPCNSSAGNCYVNLEKNDKLDGNVINGIFDNANDSDKYKIFLKGNVKIGGSRGYSNQAFFINIYDSNNKLVKSSDREVNLSLPADLYTISVFLNGYSYSTNYTKYKINITTDTLTEDEKSIIKKSLDKKPVIATELKDMIIKDDKKIFIDAFDEDDGEYVVLNATGNSNVELTFDKNILNIHPTVKKGFSEITISATSGGVTTSKRFMVVISDKDMYFGKEFIIKGKFNNSSELNKHKAILDGRCTISGYRGYSNQAFFIGLMDLDNKYINAVDKVEISTDKLKQGLYYITASLKNGNSSFGYNEDYSNYTLTVKCPNADENITKIATMIGINMETPKDSDGDGITDEDEKRYGTDPYDKHSYTTTINLNKGWNLISTPFTQALSLDKLSKDIQTIRSLQNKEWSIWSQETINSKEPKLSKIEFGKGYWVKVKDDVTLTLGGVEKTSTTPLVVDGKWHLVGSYKVDDIDKFFKSNPKITIVWKYKDGKWEAKSSNPDIQDTLQQSPDIEMLNTIDTQEAFFYK